MNEWFISKWEHDCFFEKNIQKLYVCFCHISSKWFFFQCTYFLADPSKNRVIMFALNPSMTSFFLFASFNQKQLLLCSANFRNLLLPFLHKNYVKSTHVCNAKWLSRFSRNIVDVRVNFSFFHIVWNLPCELGKISLIGMWVKRRIGLHLVNVIFNFLIIEASLAPDLLCENHHRGPYAEQTQSWTVESYGFHVESLLMRLVVVVALVFLFITVVFMYII